MSELDVVRRSLAHTLEEILDGPAPDAAYLLNRGDAGLLRSLDALSATAASRRSKGGASIAAHVDHLRYGFSLLNRWARGEDPWHDADFTASWRRQRVGTDEWRRLRRALADEARSWAAVLRERRKKWDDDGWSNALGAVAHLAYHLGAIRQIDAAARGPRA